MHAITQLKSAAGLFRAPFSMAILLLAFCVVCGSASAKPRANSTVHTVQACAVKAGKHRGSLRLISAGKRCKRGERRILWNVLGPPGSQGAAGTTGSPGEKGSLGNTGAEGATGREGKAGADGQAGTPGQAGSRAPPVPPVRSISRSKNWSKRRANRSKRSPTACRRPRRYCRE